MATLCGFFATLGALLAAIGVYGVNAYGVAQRTNEIGLRVALGANRRAILVLVFREAVLVVAAGLLAGTAVAVLAARTLRSMLLASSLAIRRRSWRRWSFSRSPRSPPATSPPAGPHRSIRWWRCGLTQHTPSSFQVN